MKRLVIGLALLSLIFCSDESCSDEDDKTKCSDHSVDSEGFSCYKYSNKFEDEEGCVVFPNNGNSQKAYLDLSNGMMKEFYSAYPQIEEGEEEEEEENKDLVQFYSNKETYEKDEEIILRGKNISQSDREIVFSKETCTYYYYGRVMDNLMQNGFQDYNGYPNIADKKVCFNAKQFPELENLIDCGYAVIKYNIGSNKYEIKTCFYIPNNKMPEDLFRYFKSHFINELFGEEGIFRELFFGISGDDSDDEDNRRLLSSTYSFEIEVEDKNGKKVKWTDTTDDIIIIEEGNNNSNILMLNLILLLSLILLY